MDERQKPTDHVKATEPKPPTEHGAPRDIPWIDRLTASVLVRLL